MRVRQRFSRAQIVPGLIWLAAAVLVGITFGLRSDLLRGFVACVFMIGIGATTSVLLEVFLAIFLRACAALGLWFLARLLISLACGFGLVMLGYAFVAVTFASCSTVLAIVLTLSAQPWKSE